MKGIQINNFFNNHISLNQKKNHHKPSGLFFDSTSPKPINSNPHTNSEEPQSMVQYDTLTPQMKIYKKSPSFSNKKKTTNTIDPISTKNKQNRKSKQKKSKSLEKFKKTLSLDKYNHKDTQDQHEISKNLNKPSKKPKIQKGKNQSHQAEGVRRSKSAIIKNIPSKTIQNKQNSKLNFKKDKKNIISADSSFKDTSKKEIKKETQNLLKKKEQTEKGLCKTARVESTKVKSKKTNDKIISQILKSSQKQDRKIFKFSTQKKNSTALGSKSYLTSAKQSKPNSARERKPSKKLFSSKQKDNLKYQQHPNFEYYMQNSGDQDNSEIKEALSELQSALQGVSSKKALAKQLKKFTSKLKNIDGSNQNSDQNPFSSQDEQSNNQAFKKIKDFKNNLVKKKLKEAKENKQSSQDKNNKQGSKQKSSKKPEDKKKKIIKNEQFQEREDQVILFQEPDVFKDSQQVQSNYINSRNPSQLIQRQKNYQPKGAIEQQKKFDSVDSEQILDERNKKYMQFLKSLQLQSQDKDNQQSNKVSQQKNTIEVENSDDLISDINEYMNKNGKIYNKNYQSQRPKNFFNQANPILERRRIDNYQEPCQEETYEKSIHNLSQDKDASIQNEGKQEIQKINQIQKLKAFQKQSDQMMSKIGTKNPEQKKRNLQIQLGSQMSHIKQQHFNNPLSSPKFNEKYPHLIKSPKFSDIQITNILAVKQKCLASKHQKMNELVQKMYERELVSPKSYEYYMYQLKKRFEDQSEGLDDFKEQASEILNEINKEKNDIKTIDELIRQQKWQEARKLMKGQNKTPSVFFGFKKNKQKVSEIYDYNQHQAQNKKEQSPKKQKLISIQNSISITIEPQKPKNKEINEEQIQKQLQNIKEPKNHEFKEFNFQKSKPTKGNLKRQDRKLDSSDEDSSYQSEGINPDSIAKQLDFQFDEKFRLKSNDDLNAIISALPKDDFDGFAKNQKTDTQQFQDYVYYQSEQAGEIQQKKVKQQSPSFSKNKGTKQQGIFKLISVPETIQKSSQISQKPQSQQPSNIVMKIDEDDINIQQTVNEKQSQDDKRTIQETKLMKLPELSQEKLDDSMSDNNSLIELQLRKGFESNLFFIKEYCISLCEYIRDNAEIKEQFKTIINQPLQFSIQDLLKKYRFKIDGDYNADYNSLNNPLAYKKEFRKPPVKAISSQLAQQFNKTYGPLKFWNVDLSKKGRNKFQVEKQTQSIFLSAILQVLNESLDFQRPGSIFGKPLPWANKSKHLKNMKYLNGQKIKKLSQDSDESAQTYDFIFGVAIARIIQWGSCLCGFLPDTAELENTEIQDDYVVHIRQTRMAFLLQKMLAEEEATFNNSQLQQTEVMLYLGKSIYEQLILQATGQISRFINLSFNQN